MTAPWQRWRKADRHAVTAEGERLLEFAAPESGATTVRFEAGA